MRRTGLYFESYRAGQTYTTDRRTITEADHVNFTTAFGFFESLFMDRSYIESHTPYENPIVPGALTFSVAEGLTILSGILHRTGIALLGVDLKILKPVHIGDTLAVAIDVIDRRKTQKPDRGIVTFRNRVSNQDGVDAMVYTVKRMIRRRT